MFNQRRQIVSQMQWNLDNERVPGQHVLMLEPPVPVMDEEFSEPTPDGQVDFTRVFTFDLTDSDAIVIDGDLAEELLRDQEAPLFKHVPMTETYPRKSA